MKITVAQNEKEMKCKVKKNLQKHDKNKQSELQSNNDTLRTSKNNLNEQHILFKQKTSKHFRLSVCSTPDQ